MYKIKHFVYSVYILMLIVSVIHARYENRSSYYWSAVRISDNAIAITGIFVFIWYWILLSFSLFFWLNNSVLWPLYSMSICIWITICTTHNFIILSVNMTICKYIWIKYFYCICWCMNIKILTPEYLFLRCDIFKKNKKSNNNKNNNNNWWKWNKN